MNSYFKDVINAYLHFKAPQLSADEHKLIAPNDACAGVLYYLKKTPPSNDPKEPRLYFIRSLLEGALQYPLTHWGYYKGDTYLIRVYMKYTLSYYDPKQDWDLISEIASGDYDKVFEKGKYPLNLEKLKPSDQYWVQKLKELDVKPDVL